MTDPSTYGTGRSRSMIAKPRARLRQERSSHLDQAPVAVIEQVIGACQLIRRERCFAVELDMHGAVAEPELGDERHVPVLERVVQEHYRTMRPRMRVDRV